MHRLKKPEWIKSVLPTKNRIGKTTTILRQNCLTTVCEQANCPNRGECFQKGTATFMLMGEICTRNCRFCNVKHGKPLPLDETEPNKIAAGVLALKLKYVVLTAVDRDDLLDGGANHFVNCIKEIRKTVPKIKIEILTPDFRGCMENALNLFSKNPANVFNHNIETVSRLYKTICPSADYQLSLTLLKKHKELMPNIPTKSGIMLGLGETDAEILRVMADLREHSVDRIILGQYLQPSIHHAKVKRYVTPKQFAKFATIAKEMGFMWIKSGPMVRSSYGADED